MYGAFLLSCPRSLQLYHIESLLAVTAVVLRETIKLALCILVYVAQ